MSFISTLFGKNSDYSAEYKRFEKAMERNPSDHGLKVQFIKFCLLNRFTKHETQADQVSEALGLFDTIKTAEVFDLQCHYLVGKYYQEIKDFRKAYQTYLEAIKRFNQYIEKNPQHLAENADLAYSVALNLLALQADPIDLEVEKCFKNIRKSFPLHVKRIELENEMAKPAPDKARMHDLAEEIRRLRADEEKEERAAAEEKKVAQAESEKKASPVTAKPPEKEDIFTKLFRVPSPFSKEWADQAPKITPEEDTKEFLKLSPVTEHAEGSAFMVFQNNDWEGPFTLSQLRPKGKMDPNTWVCRVGSQMVNQAYEVPDLHSLIH